MLKSIVCAIAVSVTAMATAPASAQDADPQRGGQIYRNCAACHSLQEGVHLTGPSLAGLWGRKAGTAEGYRRYSEPLRASDLVWDENTLNAWLAHPETLVPGNVMTFRGIDNDSARADMIAFLEVAMAGDGFQTVIEKGLVSRQLAEGQVPSSLDSVGPDQQITALRRCGDGYFVRTADGVERPYWETNVRLKTDGSRRGPRQGPVLVHSGMMGDRISIVFFDVAQIGDFVKEEC